MKTILGGIVGFTTLHFLFAARLHFYRWRTWIKVWIFLADNFHIGQHFNICKQFALIWAYKAPGNSAATGARGAANAMHIDLGVLWNVVVDHVADVVHIKSARRKIAGHKHAQLPAAQTLHDFVARLLIHVAVNGEGVDVFLLQVFGDIIHGALGAAEHHREFRGFMREQMMQQSSLAPIVNRQVALIDLAHG